MARPIQRRSLAALFLGLLVCVPSLHFRAEIQRAIVTWQILHQDHVDPGLVAELAAGTTNPLPLLEQLWGTGRIPHRASAIREFKSLMESSVHSSPPIPAWVVDAGRDLDLSVRETALNLLVFRGQREAMASMVQALYDADPEVRLLALRRMRGPEFRPLAGHAVQQLDHPDARVATAADAALRAWTGVDQGVRLSRLAGNWNDVKGDFDPLSVGELAELRRGLQQWKTWWAGQQAEFPAVTIPTNVRPGSLAATDFVMADPDGKTVRLSDFRGKTILLNFWATWCNACQEEMPGLIELQNAHGSDLTIIGVCLDRPEDQAPHDTASPNAGPQSSNTGVQDRVRDFVKARGINYRVALDPSAKVANAYASHELPTNVLVDSDGRVRRRFVGGRTLAGFESMLAELRSHAGATSQP